MRKSLVKRIMLLTLALMLIPMSINVIAHNEVGADIVIDRLFEELNAITLYRIVNDVNPLSRVGGELQLKQDDLISQLNQLGVRLLDPLNHEDLAILDKLSNVNYEMSEDSSITPFNINNPPNFAAWANIYSIFLTSGTRTINGNIYNTHIVRVVDFGHSRANLTNVTNIAVNPTANNTSAVQAVLMHTVTSAVSLAVNNPLTQAIEFVVGAVFAATSAGNNTIARITGRDLVSYLVVTVTEMRYHYVFMNNDWRFAGSFAVTSVAFGRTFGGNVNGTATIEYMDVINTIMRSPGLETNIINDYVRFNWQTTLGPGHFEINLPNNRTQRHTPRHAGMPHGL